VSFAIAGTDEIKKVLNEIAPNHARNLMRSTIHGIASTIAKDAKQNAPKDSGLLKKNIKAQRKKSPPDAPVSEVLVKNAFYWRFVEYGTRAGRREHPFIRPAKDRAMSNLNAIITEQFGKKLEALLKKQAKKGAAK
jgi:HK97 gp10 family phage protein